MSSLLEAWFLTRAVSRKWELVKAKTLGCNTASLSEFAIDGKGSPHCHSE